MLRRGLTGHLDAGEEKPWEREFDSEDPAVVFKRDRAKLVAAALTVLRGYIVAGKPRQKAKPLGGFEGWCRTVRDALLWLGAADPCLTIDSARKADPAEQRRAAVLAQWLVVLSDRSLTTREVIDEACSSLRTSSPNGEDREHHSYYHPTFRNALLDVAGARGYVEPLKLGTWLGHNKNKVTTVIDHNGLNWKVRLTAATESYGSGRWCLQTQRRDGNWQ
jgi:putative DNA primase/helicase